MFHSLLFAEFYGRVGALGLEAKPGDWVSASALENYFRCGIRCMRFVSLLRAYAKCLQKKVSKTKRASLKGCAFSQFKIILSIVRIT